MPANIELREVVENPDGSVAREVFERDYNMLFQMSADGITPTVSFDWIERGDVLMTRTHQAETAELAVQTVKEDKLALNGIVKVLVPLMHATYTELEDIGIGVDSPLRAGVGKS